MLSVRLFPGVKEWHISPIYAGLFDLQASGKLRLEFSSRFPKHTFESHILWIEVRNNKSGRAWKICFDMADWGEIASPKCLMDCQLYFKRSYDKISIEKLPKNLNRKIFPYGLYYICRSERETGFFSRLFFFLPTVSQFSKSPLVGLKDSFSSCLKLFFSIHNIKSKHVLMSEKEFEMKPCEPAEEKVLFQTRVWPRSSCRDMNIIDLEKLNESRVHLIRALKNEFGKKFVGGLIPTHFAKQKYPDCLSIENTDRRAYIKLVKKCLIGINAIGLHKSTPGKLAEYMAASRCIVSEPLSYSPLKPLKDGENYLLFKDPAECVQLCKRLFADKNAINSMRNNNFEYYRKEINPSSLISNCLRKCGEIHI
jgi:hypothetical protein